MYSTTTCQTDTKKNWKPAFQAMPLQCLPRRSDRLPLKHISLGLTLYYCSLPSSRSLSMEPTRTYPYDVPSWAEGRFRNCPAHGRLKLANLPTPLYRIKTSSRAQKSDEKSGLAGDFFSTLEDIGANLYVKRDDCSSGVELGGNKIRKLEFLLAEALEKGYDSVVTIGGEQSNHCRATAAASRMVGLSPHLILRTRKKGLDLTGNLLVDRMVGSQIYTCTPGEYGRIGSEELVARVCQYIKNDSPKGLPYPIPVGGSNALGSWGYLNAVEEMIQQCRDLGSSSLVFDQVVFACGSGGTATGIALGLALSHGALDSKKSRKIPQAVAVGVCDDPDYFYSFCGKIGEEMGLTLDDQESVEGFLRRHMSVIQGKGLGYAVSTEDELTFVTEIAHRTGIVLDPVYSGKALYNFALKVVENPDQFKGANILFWHTGGALGLYDKAPDLLPSFDEAEPVLKLDVYGKGSGVDISSPSIETT